MYQVIKTHYVITYIRMAYLFIGIEYISSIKILYLKSCYECYLSIYIKTDKVIQNMVIFLQ